MIVTYLPSSMVVEMCLVIAALAALLVGIPIHVWHTRRRRVAIEEEYHRGFLHGRRAERKEQVKL